MEFLRILIVENHLISGHYLNYLVIIQKAFVFDLFFWESNINIFETRECLSPQGRQIVQKAFSFSS